jgi:hypothetical protein
LAPRRPRRNLNSRPHPSGPAPSRREATARRFHLSHAQHREELHQVNEERQAQMQKQTKLLVETLEQNTTLTQDVEALLRQNTDLTQTIRTLAERIETMTAEVHARLAAPARS